MVVWLRTLHLMAGGKSAQREAGLMVSEKVKANAEVAMILATGGVKSPEEAALRTIKHYAPRVTANRKRLSKPPRK